jgi:hypothetical protein
MSEGEMAIPLKTTWLGAQAPFAFFLTTEGALTVEWGVALAPGLPSVARLGIVIPAEELEALRRGLEESKTIRETLAAKPPAQGAH